MLIRRFVAGVLSMGLAVAFSATAWAQVYVATSDNEIAQVNFGDSTVSPQVVETGQKFQGIGLREDGATVQIVAASTTNGGNLFAFDPGHMPGGTFEEIISFPSASGVTLDAEGNVYASNADNGGVDRVIYVPFEGGAYNSDGMKELFPVAGAPATELLADVFYVRADVSAPDLLSDDLLVLVRKPALLLRLRGVRDHIHKGTALSLSTLIDTSAFGAGTEPTGLTLARGKILITTWGGKVLQAEPDGTLVADFVSALSGSGIRIAASVTTGTASDKIYVSVHNQGLVVEYGINESGGILEGISPLPVSDGIQAPVGVVVQNGNAAYAGTGSNVTAALQNLTVTFDVVTTAGNVQVVCHTAAYPKLAPADFYLSELSCDAANAPDPCLPSSFIQLEGGVDDPLIPEFIRGYHINNQGPEVFRVCVASAPNFEFEGIAQTLSNEETWLGEGVSECDDADLTMRPKLAFAEDEAGNVAREGNIALNITNVCNRHGAGPSKWGTIFFAAVRDMRPADGPVAVHDATCQDPNEGILDCQLKFLEEALLEYAPDANISNRRDRRTVDNLVRTLASAIRRFDRGQYSRFWRDYSSFMDVLRSEGPALFAGVGENGIGELFMRATAAEFTFQDSGL